MKKRVLILGGGTAGITIASRVSQFAEVAVVERSQFVHYPWFYRIPLLGGLLFQRGKYVKQHALYPRQRGEIPFFESNVLGGASEINGCVHAFGDTALWKKQFADSFFTAEQLFQKYRERYSFSPESEQLSLNYAPQDRLDRLYLQALRQQGVIEGDMVYSDTSRCGPIAVNAGRWLRSSVVSALFRPGQYHLKQSKQAEYLEIDEAGNCIGAYVDGQLLKADRVIIAAGVLGTNQLLLNTKKRYPQWLENFDANGIKDHPNLRIKVVAKRGYQTLNELSHSWWMKGITFMKHLLGVPTIFKTPGATSAAYLDLDEDGVVDTKIQLVHFTESGRLGSDETKALFDDRPGYSLAITLLNPHSSGGMDEQGRVDPGYFSSSADRALMKRALSYGVELLKSTPLCDSVEEIVDQALIESDPETYLQNHFFSGYHLIGGVSTTGEKAVLDRTLQIRGVKGGYVCDATVFQHHVSSNTHAPVVLLAELFADHFIKQELQR